MLSLIERFLHCVLYLKGPLLLKWSYSDPRELNELTREHIVAALNV